VEGLSPVEDQETAVKNKWVHSKDEAVDLMFSLLKAYYESESTKKMNDHEEANRIFEKD
jgi:hypothetical protein